MTASLKYFSSTVSISILLIAGLCSDDMNNTKDLAELKKITKMDCRMNAFDNLSVIGVSVFLRLVLL